MPCVSRTIRRGHRQTTVSSPTLAPVRVLIVTNQTPDAATPQRGRWVSDQVEALRASGVEMEMFGFPTGRGEYLPALRRLRRRLRRESFDLVHAHYGLAGWVARLAGASRSSSPSTGPTSATASSGRCRGASPAGSTSAPGRRDRCSAWKRDGPASRPRREDRGAALRRRPEPFPAATSRAGARRARPRSPPALSLLPCRPGAPREAPPARRRVGGERREPSCSPAARSSPTGCPCG